MTLLADFLAEVEFDHLGTYRFSPEQETPAAAMPDRVPAEVIHDREALIMDLQAEISLRRQRARLGRVFGAVVDEIIPAASTAAAESRGILESLLDGVWADDSERETAAGVLTSGVSLAVCRSYHFGYDLDGVILMPAGGLQPGRWIEAEWRAVTAFDVWADQRPA